MVDSVSGIGSITNITQANRADKAVERDDTRETRRADPQDEVSISVDVQDLPGQAEAEQIAQDTREALAKNSDITLGLNRSFLDQDV